jgi:hypothetical protein
MLALFIAYKSSKNIKKILLYKLIKRINQKIIKILN